MHKPDLLNSVEAASILGKSRATLNRWAAAGRVKAVHEMSGKTGARLFDRAEIERIAAELAKAAA